ncbi:hypothetical protein D3C86_2138950 [compost metagenome]
MRRIAVTRQIQIQPGPGVKALADLLPFAALAGKTVQEYQPGLFHTACLRFASEDHR